MGNSPLSCMRKISPMQSGRRSRTIDTITLHCVVGQVSVEWLCDFFYGSGKEASCNYGIGNDGRICTVVDEDDHSWCSSNWNNDDRAVTVECASEAYEPYAINDKVYNAIIALCTDICKRHGKKKLLWFGDKAKTLSYNPKADEMVMTVHRWFDNKSCPGDYIYNRLGKIAQTVMDNLNPKIEEPKPEPEKPKEEEIVTLPEFKALYREMRKEWQDNDANEYSSEARDWAISNGIISGMGTLPDGETNYGWFDVLSREQLVTLLYRFAQLMGKA